MKYPEGTTLKFLLGISLAIIFCVNILFNDTPELFSKGYELGLISSNLSLSFVASYIFYLVVVVAKDKRDKRNVLSTVYSLTSQLTGRALSLYSTIAQAAGGTEPDETAFNVSRERFTELCEKVAPQGVSPSTMLSGLGGFPTSATYAQLIYNNSYSNVAALSEDIFKYMPFLDSEQVRLMNEVLSSTFFIIAPRALGLSVNNSDFGVYANNFYDYIILIRQLHEYNEGNNAVYVKAK